MILVAVLNTSFTPVIHDVIRSCKGLLPVVVINTSGERFSNSACEVRETKTPWEAWKCWEWAYNYYRQDMVVLSPNVKIDRKTLTQLLACDDLAGVVSFTQPDPLAGFLIRANVRERLGPFDALTKVDYLHRLGLAKVKVHHLPGVVTHVMPLERSDTLFCLAKWGCVPSNFEEASRQPYLCDGWTEAFMNKCFRDSVTGKRVCLLSDFSVRYPTQPNRLYWHAFDGLLKFYNDAGVTQVFRYVLGELAYENMVLEEYDGL